MIKQSCLTIQIEITIKIMIINQDNQYKMVVFALEFLLLFSSASTVYYRYGAIAIIFVILPTFIGESQYISYIIKFLIIFYSKQIIRIWYFTDDDFVYLKNLMFYPEFQKYLNGFYFFFVPSILISINICFYRQNSYWLSIFSCTLQQFSYYIYYKQQMRNYKKIVDDLQLGSFEFQYIQQSKSKQEINYFQSNIINYFGIIEIVVFLYINYMQIFKNIDLRQ